ncbi:hypothetical protein [Saccharothrix variisporea]|uniref:Uncharacterized protein n=1 Tax=Saccharothrix variisporea TaxID=543527 RepID=A0A495X1I1_9PSEU|nr:hypothetical protein [Saccharothrix variisporea]RKT67409.1 hypothetical protein DFJ66_0584 [Saccharothrix variisporea]
MDTGAEVARLLAESDRVAQALLAMEDHPGHLLLRASGVTGATAARWAGAEAAVVVLWEWFDTYRLFLDRVRAARDEAELVRLLTGPEVVLSAAVPVRTLTSPAVAAERVTVAELVARMKAHYAEVTALFEEVHRAWSQRLAVLDPVERRLAGLPGSRVEELRREVAAARARAVSDPLEDDPGVADLARRVAEVADLHEGFARRVEAVARRLAEAEELRAEALAVRREVVATIVGDHPGVPEVSGPRGALEALRVRFPEVREAEVAGVESAAQAVVARVRAVLEHLSGSLARRSELRGRLDAYRAKAGARGHAEDPELSALHRAAREVLTAVPCDLRAGTVAVGRYQRAVLDRTEGAR